MKDTNGLMKVLNVAETEKSVKVTMAPADDQFADTLTVYAGKRDGWTKEHFVIGQELEANLNWVQDKQDANKGFYGLKKWGDTEGKSPARTGGNTGKSWQPKSPGDIAVMQTCAITNASVAAVSKMAEFGLLGKDANAGSLCDALRAVYQALVEESAAGIQKIKEAVA